MKTKRNKRLFEELSRCSIRIAAENQGYIVGGKYHAHQVLITKNGVIIK